MSLAGVSETKIVEGVLHAMSITSADIQYDFENSISKNNHNGLPQAVWSSRCDDLIKQFVQLADIEVLHIQRTKLWQIDPVFNRSTGVLYLLFSDINLKKVRNKYIKKGTSTHYSVSFLLKNAGFLPKSNEQIELIPLSQEELENEEQRKQKDIEKMLGDNAELVREVVMISVSYSEEQAVSATQLLYTPKFELVEEKDISDMLITSFPGDNDLDDADQDVTEAEQQLVTLKTQVKEK